MGSSVLELVYCVMKHVRFSVLRRFSSDREHYLWKEV